MTQIMKILLLMSLFSYYFYCQGTVTQNPLTACEDDTITFSCVLTPPDGDMFRATSPRFLVGDSSTTLSESEINMNISHPGVDLSRISAPVVLGGTLTRISGNLILNSYLPTDAGLRLGCSAEYIDSGTSTVMALQETLPLNQTEIPRCLSPSFELDFFDSTTCNSTLKFILNCSISTRDTNYSIGINGFPILNNQSISIPVSMYNINFQLNMEYSTFFEVTNCAGVNSYQVQNIQINELSLSMVSCEYDTQNSLLNISWDLNSQSQPSGVTEFEIMYYLNITNSHSSIDYHFTVSEYQYSARLPSSFTDGNTSITAYLRTERQCGQLVTQPAMKCTLRLVNEAPIPTSIILIAVLVPAVVSVLIIFIALLLTVLIYKYCCYKGIRKENNIIRNS